MSDPRLFEENQQARRNTSDHRHRDIWEKLADLRAAAFATT
jgi:hypothetical protein